MFSEEELDWLAGLRRKLAALEPDTAMKAILKLMRMARSNSELITNVKPGW